METFSALQAICAWKSPALGKFPTQRPVTRSFDVFFDLRLNKRLSKQSWGWWFETPSHTLWRHRRHMVLLLFSCHFYCSYVGNTKDFFIFSRVTSLELYNQVTVTQMDMDKTDLYLITNNAKMRGMRKLLRMNGTWNMLAYAVQEGETSVNKHH